MEAILVIMAAGMGSRYGGLKQLDGPGPSGELIIDYSIFDAIRAGFKRFVFIIRKEHEDLFRKAIIDRLPQDIEVKLAYQSLEDMPGNFQVPEGREKPWGTAHAVYSAREYIDAPFVVINADDYYGREAFSLVHKFLTEEAETGALAGLRTGAGTGALAKKKYAMVAFDLCKTLTEKGSVSRGLCKVKDGILEEVTEFTEIYKDGDKAYAMVEAPNSDKKVRKELDPANPVSMNFWAFDPGFIESLERELRIFTDEGLKKNPLKAECYLPTAVSRDIESGRAEVRVLRTPDHWLGVTYSEDKDIVKAGFSDMARQGKYPEPLWGSR